MLKNITSLTGNGLKDWLWQRVSAVILGAYSVTLMTYIVLNPGMDYSKWTSLFECNLMRLVSVFALVSFVVHAWVGMWTISTDYIKCVCIRLSAQILMIIFLISLLVWGIKIFWSI